MKAKLLVIILGSFLVTACNYRLFDLAEYPELSGKLPNSTLGNKVTEANFDSIFQTVIQPKCLRCHNPDGDANTVPLDTYEDLTSTKFGEALVIPGKPEDSLFHIVLLPTAGRKMMPPKKSGLPPVEDERIEAIRLWIANGAPEKVLPNPGNESEN